MRRARLRHPALSADHRLYDHAQLPLDVHLAGQWQRGLAHALMHVSGEELARALAGRGW